MKIKKVIALLRDIENGLYPHDFNWIEHACGTYANALEELYPALEVVADNADSIIEALILVTKGRGDTS